MTCLSCRYSDNPQEDNVFDTDEPSTSIAEPEPCIPEVNGIYGSDQGIELPLGFVYQIETSANASIEEILDNVESSISLTILPEVFADQCASTTRLRHRRQHARRLEVRGVSSLPADKVLIGVPCQGDMAKKDCHVIDGALTLFSDDYNEKLLDDIHGLIRDEMNDGAYDNAHPDILEISYWNRKTTDSENTIGGSPPKSTLPAYAWIFIGIGISACVAFFGVWWRRRRKKGQERDYIRSLAVESLSILSRSPSETRSKSSLGRSSSKIVRVHIEKVHDSVLIDHVVIDMKSSPDYLSKKPTGLCEVTSSTSDRKSKQEVRYHFAKHHVVHHE